MTLSLFALDFLSRTLLKTFPKFPYFMIDCFIVIMPTFGYLDQIRMMYIKKCADIFSMNSALVLISANLIKVLFWFFEPFSSPLLGQSIALLLTALIHSYLHFHYKDEKDDKVHKFPHISNSLIGSRIKMPNLLESNKYLQIKNSQSYTEFLFSVVIYYIMFLFLYFCSCLILGIHFTVQISSIIANLIDSMVSLPQFMLIVVKKNVMNTSMVLIGQYLFGDIFKIFLFTVSHSPWPFTFGAVLQLCIDTIVMLTFLRIRKNNSTNKDLSPKKSPQILD